MNDLPLIWLDRITVRLRDRWHLKDTTWQIHRNEQWAILGPNGAGKTTLARAIEGSVPVVKGKIIRHLTEKPSEPSSLSIGYIGSEQHREILQQENKKEYARVFSRKFDEFTSTREAICHSINPVSTDQIHLEKSVLSISKRLSFDHALDAPVSSLSEGELTKALITKVLLKSPKLLILDEPFNGLDHISRIEFIKMLKDLIQAGTQIIQISHRIEELLPEITHLLYLKNEKIQLSGSRYHVLPNLARVYAIAKNDLKGLDAEFETDFNPRLNNRMPELDQRISIGGIGSDTSEIVSFKKVIVRYGDRILLNRIDWTVKRGEKWVLLGPNGAGKTTLLNLIMGQNLQGYANDIYLFGKKKGSGESVWEIKQRIGLVSKEFDAQYHRNISAFDVVCSGFFDSIGLYRTCSHDQLHTAGQYIKLLNLENIAKMLINQLSQGQRQMILIARAMVKSPELLILDEPCNGLDPENREKVLGIIQNIGEKTPTCLIFATHHTKEILPCMTHLLRLNKGRVIESSTL